MNPNWISPEELLRRLKSADLGTWQIIDERVVYRRGYRYVFCRCTVSGTTKFVSIDNLLAGKSRGPRGQSHKISKNSKILGARYDSMLQRCCNPSNPSYPDYGKRGIQLKFRSRREFILWVEENLPHEHYKGVDIDRINNNGHYEPGNLRLVTRLKNLLNTRRRVRYVDYRGRKVVLAHIWDLIAADYADFGYGREWTVKLVKSGLPIEDIIRKGRTRKPKRIDRPRRDILQLYPQGEHKP